VAAVLYNAVPAEAAAGALTRLAALAQAPPAGTRAARQAQYRAACLVAQWKLLREPGTPVTAFTAVLRRGVTAVDPNGAPEANPVCLALVEALTATNAGNADGLTTVRQLDSLMLLAPAGTELTEDGGDPTLQGAELLLARALEHHGLVEEASRAAWRGEDKAVWGAGLRDQGRMAALAGNREEAIRVYEYYLSLRWDPEPALVPQRDSVKAELAALVREQ